jgi:hypothetical protein
MNAQEVRGGDNDDDSDDDNNNINKTAFSLEMKKAQVKTGTF